MRKLIIVFGIAVSFMSGMVHVPEVEARRSARSIYQTRPVGAPIPYAKRPGGGSAYGVVLFWVGFLVLGLVMGDEDQVKDDNEDQKE